MIKDSNIGQAVSPANTTEKAKKQPPQNKENVPPSEASKTAVTTRSGRKITRPIDTLKRFRAREPGGKVQA